MLATIKKFVDNLLGVKILYEGVSDYGSLEVYEEQGTINLTVRGKFVQSSYRPGKKPLGSVWDYFLIAPLFASNPEVVKSVCILGLGAGNAVKLLNQAYKIERIVGVEIDKKVVNLGRRFFDLNDANLEVVIGDASKYVRETTNMFDLIIVDTFKGSLIDPACSSFDFFSSLTKIVKENGVVLVNRVNTKEQERINKRFLHEFPQQFTQCYALRVRKNTFYFGLKIALNMGMIVERINRYATDNIFMGFLKKFNKKDLYQVK